MKMWTMSVRRGLASLLIVVLLFAATATGAAWQCLDGTPCAPGCRMMEHVGQTPQAHSCCPAAESLSLRSPRAGQCETACTSSPCVVRVKPKPEVLIQPHFQVPAETSANLPSNITIVAVPVQPVYVATAEFHPPRDALAGPHSPRSPPVLL